MTYCRGFTAGEKPLESESAQSAISGILTDIFERKLSILDLIDIQHLLPYVSWETLPLCKAVFSIYEPKGNISTNEETIRIFSTLLIPIAFQLKITNVFVGREISAIFDTNYIRGVG